MTDVEFSALLTTLTNTAETLNAESADINTLIDQMEEKLQALNLGFEVWVNRCPLTERLSEEENYDRDIGNGPLVTRGTQDTQLGYTKIGDAWRLAIRTATWQYVDPEQPDGEAKEIVHGNPTPLNDAPRHLRIKALEAFPALIWLLQEEAEKALQAITRAKKFIIK
jgi:hypothetical protein